MRGVSNYIQVLVQEVPGWVEITGVTTVVLLCFELMLRVHMATLGYSEIGHLLFQFLNANRFLSYGLLGAFIIHMWTHPSRLLFVVVIFIACTLRLGAALSGESLNKSVPPAFLGIGSLTVLIWNACRYRGAVRRGYLGDLGAAALVPVSAFLIDTAVSWTGIAQRRSHDALLYRFDHTLGFEPSFIVGSFFHSWPAIEMISTIIYGGLPAIVCVLYAVQRSHRNYFRMNLIMAMGIAAVAGFGLYLIYPAAGPRYFLGDSFPLHPPTLAQISHYSLGGKAILNAMPSLHMAWVLLILWNVANSSFWPRFFAGAVLLFTILATLGLGEHYFVDLVVAFPFALTVQAACVSGVSSRLRYISLGIGAILLLASLLVLEFGVSFIESRPSISWAFVLVNVLVSNLIVNRLLNESFHSTVNEGFQLDSGQ